MAAIDVGQSSNRREFLQASQSAIASRVTRGTALRKSPVSGPRRSATAQSKPLQASPGDCRPKRATQWRKVDHEMRFVKRRESALSRCAKRPQHVGRKSRKPKAENGESERGPLCMEESACAASGCPRSAFRPCAFQSQSFHSALSAGWASSSSTTASTCLYVNGPPSREA